MAKAPRPHIIVNGRSFPLFQRGKGPHVPWSVRAQVKGTRRTLSTSTPDLAQAKERARSIIEAALAEDWSKVESFRPAHTTLKPYATVAQVLKAATSLPVASVPSYTRSLLKIITAATGRPEHDARRMTADQLTAPLVRAFQAAIQGLPRAAPDTPTANNATANSLLKNARSLFSKKALAHYERLGLNLPPMHGFHEPPLLTAESTRYSDSPIPDATLREIDAALPADVRKTHEAIRLLGTPPGQIPAAPARAHARFLNRWGLTPSDLWHHATACMVRRTSSLEVAAQWANMSLPAARWHFAELLKGPEPLRREETFLGF